MREEKTMRRMILLGLGTLSAWGSDWDVYSTGSNETYYSDSRHSDYSPLVPQENICVLRRDARTYQENCDDVAIILKQKDAEIAQYKAENSHLQEEVRRLLGSIAGLKKIIFRKQREERVKNFIRKKQNGGC